MFKMERESDPLLVHYKTINNHSYFYEVYLEKEAEGNINASYKVIKYQFDESNNWKNLYTIHEIYAYNPKMALQSVINPIC